MQRKPMLVLWAWIWMALCIPTLHAQYIEYVLDAQSYDFTRQLAKWNPSNPELRFPNALGVGYTHQLTPFISYFIPVHVGKVVYRESNTTRGKDKWVLDGDIAVKLELFNHHRWLSPYLWTGVGGYFVYDAPGGEGLQSKVPLGVGLNVKLYDRVFAQLSTSYNRNITVNRGYFTYGIGLKYVLGKELPKQVRQVPVHIAADKDKDGIPDAEDRCPKRAGVAVFSGCPDSDGDWVPDDRDQCPEEAGIEANGGCPLQTLVSEKEDGTEKTLPGHRVEEDTQIADRDRDGIPDSEDACPELYGIRQKKGCPEEDRDGDGVPDSLDLCPNRFGSVFAYGCPRDSSEENYAVREPRIPQQERVALYLDVGKDKTRDEESPSASQPLLKTPDASISDSTGDNKAIGEAEVRSTAHINRSGIHEIRDASRRAVNPAPSGSQENSLSEEIDNNRVPAHYDTVKKEVVIVDTIHRSVILYDTVFQPSSTHVARRTTTVDAPSVVDASKAKTGVAETGEGHPTINEEQPTLRLEGEIANGSSSTLYPSSAIGQWEASPGLEDLTLVFPYKVGALQPTHVKALEHLVRAMKMQPDSEVYIWAYANDYSRSSLRMRLASKRTIAIMKYLEIRQISPHRIHMLTKENETPSDVRAAFVHLMK